MREAKYTKYRKSAVIRALATTFSRLRDLSPQRHRGTENAADSFLMKTQTQIPRELRLARDDKQKAYGEIF